MMHGHGENPSPFESSGGSAPPLAAFHALKRAMGLNRQLMMKTLAEHGGHPGQASCLMVLSHHDGISQRDLADRMHLAAPTVSTMLQKLERGGSVERRVDEHDQRLTRLTLTSSGRAQGDAMRAAHDNYVNTTFAKLSESDLLELARLLDALSGTMSSALEQLDEAAGNPSTEGGPTSC